VTASSLPVTSLQSPRYVPITETPRETKTKTLIDVLLQELQQTLLCISDALPLPLQHVCALAALEAWRLRDAARATSTTTNTNTALAANCIRLQCAAVRNRLAALHCTALHCTARTAAKYVVRICGAPCSAPPIYATHLWHRRRAGIRRRPSRMFASPASAEILVQNALSIISVNGVRPSRLWRTIWDFDSCIRQCEERTYVLTSLCGK